MDVAAKPRHGLWPLSGRRRLGKRLGEVDLGAPLPHYWVTYEWTDPLDGYFITLPGLPQVL